MKNSILFLLSHQPNPRFVKQIKFLNNEFTTGVVYFYREYLKDLSLNYEKNINININIGNISNGNYFNRIFKYFQSIQKLKKILKKDKFDTLIVNNIDTLALYKLATIFNTTKPQIIIEISDLRSHTYTNSIKSKIIRNIEKIIFRSVDKLVVTSPKFYDMYYHKLFNDKYFLLENKPLSSMIPNKKEKIKNKKKIIGIVGLLLQGKPYVTLLDLLKNNDDYEIHIYGKGTYQNLIEDYASNFPNIKYFGEYDFFKDSASIYSSLDILYMPYDTTNGSLNNKIALPNKLYESMYFSVPIITSKGTYLSEIVEKYSIGYSIKCCDKTNLLECLNNIELSSFKNNFATLDDSLYLGDNDYKLLKEYICN